MPSSLSKNDVVLLKWLLRRSRENEEVVQSTIPSKTKLNPKLVSKVINKLEKMGLIERTPIMYNKRKTYIVKPNIEAAVKALKEIGEDFINIEDIIEEIIAIPCIRCPHTEKCYEGGFYDPLFCPLLTDYIEKKINNSNKKHS
ncbi:MAG: MarR family transcriptional regulator [Desulfurococcaceae archaeon]|jgi:DNA-binding MarR family transcriptional regulator|nr:MarR family transcriptional regulator [Desulfurococcaceae archaeon]